MLFRSRGFDPWIGKIPWRTNWQPSPVFLPGKSPQTEEPGGLQPMGLQRVGHHLVERATGRRVGQEGGQPGRQQAQTSGGILPRNQAVGPPQKSDHSGSNKGRWRLPPTGASASVSMATPLPGQSGDSELPTATPWQPAPPEGGPWPSGAEEKLRPGEGPHPAPCPPNSPTRGPRRSTHHSVESAGVDLGR